MNGWKYNICIGIYQHSRIRTFPFRGSYNPFNGRRVSNMFENKLINGIHASRYIASWLRSGGDLRYDDNRNFYKWLLSIGLTEDDARHIKRLAENGKLELEVSATKFINELPPDEEEL